MSGYVTDADADRIADELIGPIVDSAVSRAYSAPARQFDAGSEALELCKSGLSARDAVDSVRVRFELDDSEAYCVTRLVEFSLRREERGR